MVGSYRLQLFYLRFCGFEELVEVGEVLKHSGWAAVNLAFEIAPRWEDRPPFHI